MQFEDSHYSLLRWGLRKGNYQIFAPIFRYLLLNWADDALEIHQLIRQTYCGKKNIPSW